MKIILILMGIYLYMVIGNLTVKLVTHLEELDYLPPQNEGNFGVYVLWFGVIICIPIIMLIHALIKGRIKFPNIPFTPAKVAEKILKFDYSKIFKYRIRIATKTEKMVYDSQAGVDTNPENEEFRVNDCGTPIPQKYHVLLDKSNGCFGSYIPEDCDCDEFVRCDYLIQCKKFTEGK